MSEAKGGQDRQNNQGGQPESLWLSNVKVESVECLKPWHCGRHSSLISDYLRQEKVHKAILMCVASYVAAGTTLQRGG
jgi:hypothetical protein